MTADESPAVVLRRAAQVLQARAERATPGPWTYDNYYDLVDSAGELPPHVCGRVAYDMNEPDGAWIALMSPEIAEPLVHWLSDEASNFEVEQRTEPASSNDEYALDFARAIVRGVA